MASDLSGAHAAEISFVVPSNATASLSIQYQDIVRDFNRAHPEDNVNFLPRSSYNQVLDLMLRKETQGIFAAEIAELYTLQDAGAIAAIDNFVGGDEKWGRYLESFVPAFLTNSRDDQERLYALPLFRSTPIIYYNLDMLKAAGLNSGHRPKTWSELTDTLIVLRDHFNRPPLALPGVWREWIFESFAQQNNSPLSSSRKQLNFDNPRTIEALERWVEWHDQGLVLLPENWRDGIHGFLREIFPVTYYSTAGMGLAREKASFDWITDVMPGNPGPGAVVGGANLFLSSGMDPEQHLLAKRLLRHLLVAENQAKISAVSGYFPVVKSAFYLTVLSDLYDREPAYINARRQLDTAHARIMVPRHKEIRVIFQQAIADAFGGRYSAQEALSIAQKKASKLLAE
ncbi:extracellular solute-binding protein [Kiloniella sp.]|uniref:extracellular solute-binding protein n=1 Tax=Kiloniella sp. TaxID=1938587 RepID=UPI003B0199B8